MKWYLLGLPVAGLALYLLLKPEKKPMALPEHTPAPSGPAATAVGESGGTRAKQYLLRLEAALQAWKVAIPFARDTQKTVLLGTVDVVKGMAQADALSGAITKEDLAAIENRAKSIGEEISKAA